MSCNTNLHLNCAKSHKIVFCSRRLREKAELLVPPCPDIECVDKLTFLVIIVYSSLTATDHVSSLLASCSSLRVLRSHGLPNQSLKDVFHATVIGKLMHCAPAWHRYVRLLTMCDLTHFCAIVYGYIRHSATVTDMFLVADNVLFCTTKHTFSSHIFLIDQKLSTHSALGLTISLLFVKLVIWMIVIF